MRPGRGAALATALILLAGCSAIGSMGRSLGGALLPGSSSEKAAGAASNTSASQRSAAQPARAPAGLPPDPNRTPRADVAGSGGDLDARMARLEQQVAALRQDMDRTKPNIDRLVGIEDDIRVLLGQLARLNDPNAPAVPAARPAAPGAPPPAGAPASLPPPPTNSAPVLGGAPRSLSPITPVPSQAAPPQTLGAPPQNLTPPPNAIAAAPAPAPVAGRAAPTVAARDQLAVHIASYKEEAAARRGWQEMQAQQGNLLAGLDFRISPITLSGGRGTFYRLKAGPFTDSASANEVCSALKARRVYCVVTDFSGT